MSEEVTGTAPAPADVQQTPAVETAPAQPAEPKAEAQPATPPPEPRKPDPRQRKIAELSYQNRELERRIDRLLGVVEKTTTTGRQPEVTAPKIEDFSDLGQFIEATVEYREKLKANDSTPKAEPKETIDDDIENIEEAREILREAGNEKYEDFEELVFTNDLKITKAMAKAIFETEDPSMQAELAYYLAKNPKEVSRIARLSSVRQNKEIGKLEMKLSSEPEKPKKPSAAPTPITPVGGNNTPADEIAPEMPFEKFLKIRNKQLGR